MQMVQIIFLAVGAVAGGVVVWLLMRGRVALAEATGRCAAEADKSAAAEQARSLAQELSATKARLGELQTDSEGFRAEARAVGEECAQLRERTARLTTLEHEVHAGAQANDLLQKELADLRETTGRLNAQVVALREQSTQLQSTHERAMAEKESLSQENARQQASVAQLQTLVDAERKQMQEKLALLQEARQELSNQFKAVAGELLEEKSRKFTEQNQVNLHQLLDPLKERLAAFQTKVEEVYVQESKDRSALGEQVRHLTELNATLSQDAQNLALALRGDRKAQGNWGEIILEDVLERAGLVHGVHYHAQGGVRSEDGTVRDIPDIVVHLPGDRHIVVDSKLTLPDYRLFASADDDEQRDAALKRHLSSTRAHMKGLCEKKYHALYGLNSLDFVVMFFPLEPAFMLAITNDRELYHDAWDKNILLVSPSTLLFVIRTVAHLWRQEDLSRNAKEISQRGADLYDKLVGFVTDLQDVGKRLNQAQDCFNEARKKLSEGKGNVIRQAELLKNLGVKPSKKLPSQWVEQAVDPGTEIANGSGQEEPSLVEHSLEALQAPGEQ